MNLKQALVAPLTDSRWRHTFGILALVGFIPLLGQLVAYHVAILMMRHASNDRTDESASRIRLDWMTLWGGMRALLVIMLSGLAVAITLGILLIPSPPDFGGAAPLLAQAFSSPSNLVVVVVTSAVASLCLARLAATDSIYAAFHIGQLWRTIRAEPAIWIATGLVGTLFVDGPGAAIWALHLNGSLSLAVNAALVSLLWPYALLVQAHLIGQAAALSSETAKSRQTAVRLRW